MIEAPIPEPQPALVPEPALEPEFAVEPIIVRMEDAPLGAAAGGRGPGTRRASRLEKVLSDFEQRSQAIEADIARVRTTLRSLRDA